MLLTQRKRRQILKGLLPLLVIVWAAMPSLPCCQAIAGVATENSVGVASRGTSVHSSHGSLKKAAQQSAQLTSAKQVIADRDGLAPNTDTESQASSCADVDKNHHEVRGSICLDIAHIALVVFLPIPAALVAPVSPPGAPPPPLQRRPLHLSKSVLLI